MTIQPNTVTIKINKDGTFTVCDDGVIDGQFIDYYEAEGHAWSIQFSDHDAAPILINERGDEFWLGDPDFCPNDHL